MDPIITKMLEGVPYNGMGTTLERNALIGVVRGLIAQDRYTVDYILNYCQSVGYQRQMAEDVFKELTGLSPKLIINNNEYYKMPSFVPNMCIAWGLSKTNKEKAFYVVPFEYGYAVMEKDEVNAPVPTVISATIPEAIEELQKVAKNIQTLDKIVTKKLLETDEVPTDAHTPHQVNLPYSASPVQILKKNFKDKVLSGEEFEKQASKLLASEEITVDEAEDLMAWKQDLIDEDESYANDVLQVNENWNEVQATVEFDDIWNEVESMANEDTDFIGFKDNAKKKFEANKQLFKNVDLVEGATRLYQLLLGFSPDEIKGKSKFDKKHSAKICPNCGCEITGYPAISRRDNKTEICSQCGEMEAMEDFYKYFSTKKKSSLGFFAKPENEKEELVVKIADEIIDASMPALEKNKWNGWSTQDERQRGIDIVKEAIAPVVEKYKAELQDEEIFNMLYDHNEDNNYHTENTALEELLGKGSKPQVSFTKTQSSKKVKSYLSEDRKAELQKEAKKIIKNFDPKAIKVEVDENGGSVLIADNNSDFQAWVDVWIDYGNVDCDWNQYITYINDAKEYRDLQVRNDTETVFDLATSMAVQALEEKGVIVQEDDASWHLNKKSASKKIKSDLVTDLIEGEWYKIENRRFLSKYLGTNSLNQLVFQDGQEGIEILPKDTKVYSKNKVKSSKKVTAETYKDKGWTIEKTKDGYVVRNEKGYIMRTPPFDTEEEAEKYINEPVKPNYVKTNGYPIFDGRRKASKKVTAENMDLDDIEAEDNKDQVQDELDKIEEKPVEEIFNENTPQEYFEDSLKEDKVDTINEVVSRCIDKFSEKFKDFEKYNVQILSYNTKVLGDYKPVQEELVEDKEINANAILQVILSIKNNADENIIKKALAVFSVTNGELHWAGTIRGENDKVVAFTEEGLDALFEVEEPSEEELEDII